jgi:hypothetical protein
MSQSAESESSQLSEKALNKVVVDVQPLNTELHIERSTRWDARKFQIAKRAIKSVTAEELNNVLRRFYGELKNIKGELFTSSALTGIRAAIQRYIANPPFKGYINIIVDK